MTSPVTSPVNGPANASEVTVPSKNASLNSNELVPKSTSLSVTGLIAPSAITTWAVPAVKKVKTSSSAPAEDSVVIFVSWSTSIVPPNEPQAEPE